MTESSVNPAMRRLAMGLGLAGRAGADKERPRVGSPNGAAPADARVQTIFGYYGQKNAGDEAFRLVLQDVFNDRPVEFVGNMQNAARTDHVVFGGGAVLNPYFVDQLKDAGAIYVVGCSLPNGGGDLAVIEKMRGRCKCFYLRSKEDVAMLEVAGLPATYTPDIVFAAPLPDESFSLATFLDYSNLEPPGFGQKPHTVIAFLSDDYTVIYSEAKQQEFLRGERFKRELAAAFDKLAEHHNVVFVPMSVWFSARDHIYALDVVRRMRHRTKVCVVERYMDPRQIMAAVNSLDATVVSMKFHGLVFGLMSGKLVVNIGSTRKNQTMMRDADLTGLSFRYDTVTARSIVDAVGKRGEARLLEKIGTLAQGWRSEARLRLAEFRNLVPR